MAIRNVVKHRRPSVDVAFYEKTDAEQAMADAYKADGTILQFQTFFSEDNLIKTTKTDFANEEAYDRYHADPQFNALSEKIRSYNKENGITKKMKKLIVPNKSPELKPKD